MSNKIPPPVITLIGALLIYYSSPFFPYFTLPAFNALPILSLVSGIAVIVFAIKSFKDYKTTINPLKPETASSLVTNGVFKYTRNPMYLGLLLILIYLSLIFNVVGGCLVSLGFIIYITKFQIIPEEVAMEKLFGNQFLEYKQQVRRWI